MAPTNYVKRYSHVSSLLKDALKVEGGFKTEECEETEMLNNGHSFTLYLPVVLTLPNEVPETKTDLPNFIQFIDAQTQEPE